MSIKTQDLMIGQAPRRYLVILEEGQHGYSAYAPDLPGCVAAADTSQDCIREMRSALAFHIEGLLLEGEAVPEPSSSAAYVEL